MKEEANLISWIKIYVWFLAETNGLRLLALFKAKKLKQLVADKMIETVRLHIRIKGANSQISNDEIDNYIT